MHFVTSPRLGDAPALGLLDEIVEPSELTDAVIRLVHRWTRPGAYISNGFPA
ncbi:hypothetical protein [Acrocarpospora pleiomorpha]|nr:hypothetical protein [Acrocarpospora pleiomorpha]